MTTMDSDSESQDSDDGRRFRFEATRKDATLVSHNRKRVSPHSDRSERHQRSSGRLDRDRRNNDRFSNRNRDSRSRHNSRQTSRDRDSKDRRDRHSSQNYLKDSKDAQDSKHLKHRNGKESKSSPTQREKDDRDSKDNRDSKDRRDLKSSWSREKDSKIPRESRSSRDRNIKRSRDRSRSDRSSSDKYKVRDYDKYKNYSKDNHSKVEEDQVPNKSEKDTKASLAIGQIVNDSNKVVADSAQDGCTEFNISDFEIVSDLEEISSDTSNRSYGHRSKVKKRQSKQQSLRLSDRNSDRKSHRKEDLRKVNPRNGNHSSASSNSNPSALSDFSLGSASPTTSTNKKLKGDEDVATQMEVDDETSHDSSYSKDTTKINQRDKTSSYGPILPPKLVKSSSPRPADSDEEMNEIIVKIEDVQNKDIVKENIKEEKLIGPFLPSSSSKSSDQGIEDDFSSAKKGELNRKNCNIKNEPEEDSSNRNIQDGEVPKESPQPRIIGPSLPVHLLPQKMESDEDTFGPALPPHLIKKDETGSKTKIFGPTLPSELKSDNEESADEDVIGPLPVDHPATKTSIVQKSLEFRARRIQNEFMTEPITKEKKREEWMTELPPVQAAALGLGPRKFKMRDGPDLSDRSSWTDTPVDKVRKEQEQAEERLAAIATQKKMVKEIPIEKVDSSEKSKKRQKSLLEVHQKKLKKKKKKEEKEARDKGKPTRRPFDRDVDLEANRFDEAQKKHIFMKAQLLDDRFARGSM